MTNKSFGWQEPLTPWEVVERQFFHEDGVPDAAAFAKRHGLNEAEVREVFSGKALTFSPALCAALARETGMTEDFFRNLSDQQQRVSV